MCRSSSETNGWHLISNEVERRARTSEDQFANPVRRDEGTGVVASDADGQMPADPADGGRESVPGTAGCR